MGLAHEKFEKFKETAQFLASRQFNGESLIKYYNEVFPRTYKGKKNVEVKSVEDLATMLEKHMTFLVLKQEQSLVKVLGGLRLIA